MEQADVANAEENPVDAEEVALEDKERMGHHALFKTTRTICEYVSCLSSPLVI
jgi:hypothetical protein